MLYIRFLLVIYFIYSKVYMSFPISQFIPAPLYPLVTKFCFLHLWLYSCFVKKRKKNHLYHFFKVPYVNDITRHVSFFIWLISFSMTISMSIHVVANAIILFFLWLSDIPLCLSTVCCAVFSRSVVSNSLRLYGLQLTTFFICKVIT